MTDVDTNLEPIDEAGLELVPIETVPIEVSLRESFEALYARMFDRMRRLAFVLVDTEEQAAEVVQDAFAKLYPRYDRIRDPEAYVRVSVLNFGRRALRRRGLDRARVRPEPDAPASQHDHVLDAVRRLPTRQRDVVVLRYYLQLTDDEIASTLDMRLGTVKSTLHRARATLREVLPS